MDTIHCYVNKKKLSRVLLLTIALFFVFLYGAYYYFNNDEYMTGGNLPQVSAFKFFAFFTILLAMLSLLCIKGLMNKKQQPLVTITNDGIILKSNIYLKWDDISAMYINSVYGEEFIGFRLAHPDTYLRQFSFWRHMMYLMNERLCGAHFTIGNLDIPLDKVFEIISNKARFKEFNKN